MKPNLENLGCSSSFRRDDRNDSFQESLSRESVAISPFFHRKNNYFFQHIVSSASILHPPPTTSLCQEESRRALPASSFHPAESKAEANLPDYDYEQERRRLMMEEIEKPCSTCRYTGIAVCTGLSLYFLKLGLEETVAKTAKSSATNKAFFYGGAITWALAGVYRSMLD